MATKGQSSGPCPTCAVSSFSLKKSNRRLVVNVSRRRTALICGPHVGKPAWPRFPFGPAWPRRSEEPEAVCPSRGQMCRRLVRSLREAEWSSVLADQYGGLSGGFRFQSIGGNLSSNRNADGLHRLPSLAGPSRIFYIWISLPYYPPPN